MGARLAIGKYAVSYGRDVRLALLILLLLPAVPTGSQTPTLAEVMRRVHEYVTVYEDHELSTVIAHERYYQQLFDGKGTPQAERTLLSDYLLVQLPDEDWVALRDVYDVDGIVKLLKAGRECVP